MDVAYTELSKVRLPGFRKGKAPRWLLKSAFPKHKADVADKLVQRGSKMLISHMSLLGVQR